MSDKKKLLLIDTFNFLHRAYHALPKTFTDKEGNPTNAVYGVTSMLINIFDTIKPDYVVAALESKDEDLNRTVDFTGYKAHRKPMDDALDVQIEPVLEIISAFGITKLMLNGYEADDIIGTLSKKFNSPEIDVIMASNDRDLWQLLGNNVLVMLPNTQGNIEWVGVKEAEARLGFRIDQLVDYKALKGDPSDNIPGVAGVGEKTAKELLQDFDNLENIYNSIEHIKSESLRNKLVSGRESAFMSKKLATIITDLPVDITLDQCKYTIYSKIAVREVLEKYNFKSLIRRLEIGDAPYSRKTSNDVPDNQMPLF